MAHLFVNLKVSSYRTWKTTFDESSQVLSDAGCIGDQVFRSGDDPFQVFLLLEWDELERARQFVQSPQFASILQNDDADYHFMSEV